MAELPTDVEATDSLETTPASGAASSSGLLEETLSELPTGDEATDDSTATPATATSPSGSPTRKERIMRYAKLALAVAIVVALGCAFGILTGHWPPSFVIGMAAAALAGLFTKSGN